MENFRLTLRSLPTRDIIGRSNTLKNKLGGRELDCLLNNYAGRFETGPGCVRYKKDKTAAPQWLKRTNPPRSYLKSRGYSSHGIGGLVLITDEMIETCM